jgi:kynureninase
LDERPGRGALSAARAALDHDPEPWRPRFPILRESTYLVTHSLGAMPLAVYDKLRDYADGWAELGVRAWSEAGWWESPVSVGNQVGRIMNAPPDTVVMHQNVSVIQSIVASALDFSTARRRVVYTDQNFPTNMYVWEGYRRAGAEIVSVPSRDGISVPLEDLLAAIDERTLIVPISHVLFRTSALQDAQAVCRRAREVGALVLLDTYQSLGTVPVDVQALGVDMICGGSVKWLCGGPGAGYLYVRPGLLERLEPRITGWAAHAAPFEFETGPQRYAAGPMRLLHGSPAVPALLAATAGYEAILEVGVERIRGWSVRLTERLRQRLLERGFAVPSPEDPARRGGTLTVGLAPDEQGRAWVAALAARRILVDHRPNAGLRVSPHFYTREEELDEFVEVLAELRRTGRWREFVRSSATY